MNRKLTSLCILLVIGMIALWGCPKKAEVTATPETPREAAPVDDAAEKAREEAAAKERAAAAAKAAEEARLAAEARERERAAAAQAKGLQPIYFDFDRSFIRDDARDVMKANVEWLKANPKVKVRIEGNCDERGTREYNQALGQRRATSAKKYLTDMGISAKRISMVSYGKEKQVCSEGTEECWQKNRRGDFIAVNP